MGWWTDLAEKHAGTPNHGGPMVEQRGAVEHIAAGTYAGTIAWQMNPTAQVSSHFIVAKDGRITQMLDTTVTAWTQQLGNGHWVSIENEGQVGDSLTPQQVEASAQLFARGHREHGWLLQIADAPSGRGLGHHSMGAENGVQWGHSACPGAPIKAQKPAIVARAIQIAQGTQPPLEDDMDFNQSAKLDAVFALLDAVPLDTDATPDGKGATRSFPVPLTKFLKDLSARIAAPVPIDPAVLTAAVNTAVQAALENPSPAFLAAVAKAVVNEDHRRSAE